MNHTKKLFTGLIVTATLLTGACAPPSDKTDSEQGESLVIYSNSVGDGRGEWLSEQAKAAGFTLNFVDLGGGDVMNRLTAEKNNPLADVTFGLNNVYFEKLKAQDVLEPYTPAWSDDVDASLGDADTDLFWPIVREPVMLVYNKAAYPSAADAPQDWSDLWTKPQFENRYEVQTTLGGATTQMVIAGILARYPDPEGELGVSAEGWSQIESYFAKGNPSVPGTDLYARMKSGEVDAGQMWLAGKPAREAQYDIESEAVEPAIGVPYAVQQVALVKGTKKTEEAKRFIDWFGSADVQAAWSNKFFTAPTNRMALATADQDAIAQTDSFTVQDIDWDLVARNIDKWIEKIELEYSKG
ncbi:iron ABC transporter substrate-binding protein [Rhodococcus sp. NKCM2511]|jgi:iron(III) transport system substrate-binding protein|uniref:extracellular solute-binding protein n=1 Tax=Rhodococcus sp. NKCM2511 TaxID=2766011 RepID=UPI0019103368|nr:extracellular solute-binding protein [Rhodococcus sp. NKCM2511]GHP19155.1 iron ABC transporter substrate-binding protein [Rhodococcus sp. NKCM2511]